MISEKLLLKISLLGLLIFKMSTIHLWFSFYRDFPFVPVLDFLDTPVETFQNILSGSACLLIIVLTFKITRIGLILLIVAEVVLLSLDMMRWQPPVFQFILCFVAFLYNPKKFPQYLLLLLSATYIYAGLHTFNLRFINFFWSRQFLVNTLEIPTYIAYSKALKAVGFIIPLLETIAGLLLLSKWKKLALYSIICIHCCILLYIGPWGINYNSAVWGWNVCMILYALWFIKSGYVERIHYNFFSYSWICILFLVPLLNLAGYYYPYFSFDLYSVNKHYLLFQVEVDDHHQLKRLSTDEQNSNHLIHTRVFSWSMENINVPFTHHLFLYERFTCAMQVQYPNLMPCYEIVHYPYKNSTSLMQ